MIPGAMHNALIKCLNQAGSFPPRLAFFIGYLIFDLPSSENHSA